MSETGSTKRREVTVRLAEKLLMPLVATAASAAAGYAAKKAPEIFEQKVQPTLRNAKKSAGSAGDLAGGLTERAKEVAGGMNPLSDDTDGAASRPARTAVDNDELARRRESREERRAARRKRSKA